MSQSNYKSIILNWLLCFSIVVCMVHLSGCKDNPEAEEAKKLRGQTTQAVKLSVEQKYEDAQKMVQDSLNNRSRGLTKDAAYLAGGNMAMAAGRQLQSDLGLKTLPLRGNIDKLEKVIRNTESHLVEKERISLLMKAGDNEVVQLQQLLDGNEQNEGLGKQLEMANAHKQQLLSQKSSLQQEKDKIQRVLDEQQSSSDNLIRQAELEKGDRRLALEKKAFSILEQRKPHYIKIQDVENQISILNNEISLAQVNVDGFTKAQLEARQRINEILSSPSRATLQKQLAEIEDAINLNQQRLTKTSNEITSGLKAYRQDSDKICGKYQQAISDYERVSSADAQFTAILSLSDSAYLAALTCSDFVKVHQDTRDRLRRLIESTDPQLIPMIQSQLPSIAEVNADYKDAMFSYFEKAAQTYETAFSRASGRDEDVQCSIARSHLLTLHSKMQIADLIEAFEIAESTETEMNALIEKGNELGARFTQSEAMRLVTNIGLNYLPSIPINMEVFMDEKKQEFSGWKLLPWQEQEAEVDKNIAQIDELILKYGQDAALHLEPLKQEMVAAKEKGFEEPATGTRPGPGEPNSL